MKKKIFSIFFALVLVLGLSLATAVPMAMPVAAADITVGGDYDTIQEAIDAADPGDIILVAAGTYNETPTLKDTTAPGISIIGEDKTTTFITGGICFAADYSGLTVQSFTITGNGFLLTETYEATVSCHWYGHFAVTNFELSDCVLDGENYDAGTDPEDPTVGGRTGVVIKRLGGVVKFIDNVFKNYPGWAVIDVNDGSGGEPLTVTSYTLTGNDFLDNEGGVALRGNPGDYTDTVIINGNTSDGPAGWAAIETNYAASVEIYENVIRNTEEFRDWGEGQAIQLWQVGTANIHENTIEDNYQGIGILNYPEPYDISNISVYHNSFSGNIEYALLVEDGLIGGPLNALYNWWGDSTGPDHASNLHGIGQGGDVISDNVDFTPWYATATTTPSTENVSVVHNPVIALSDTIQGGIDAALTGDTISVAAGTYNERVDINKSLTLEGANVGTPGSGTRNPESIINPQWLEIFDGDTGKDFGVLIYGEDTIATIDGFTVENYHRVGILAGSYSLNQEEYPNPSVVHILNNIISEPIGEHNNNCIQMGFGTTGTIIGNEVFGAVLESPDYSGTGILVSCSSDVLVSNNYVHDSEGGIQIMGWPESGLMGPAVSNVIEYNLVVGNESGIVAQQNAIDTIIRHNDALNNASGIVSVGWFNSPGYFPSGTQIHYNNIVDNLEYGVKSSTWDEGGPEEVDALYNWWGHKTGPDHATLNPGAKGNAVSDYVNFSPWLYGPQENFISDAPFYAGSVVIANEATQVDSSSYAGGWNSFSTPVTLAGSTNTWGDILALTTGSNLDILRAQRFNNSTQQWVLLSLDYKITPGEGFYIQVKTGGSLPILCNINVPMPPRTDLLAGWNLVGVSDFYNMAVLHALSGVSYSVVLSALPPNVTAWSVPPTQADERYMLPGEAYWVAMGEPGILFGHTTTPVAEDMTWELNK